MDWLLQGAGAPFVLGVCYASAAVLLLPDGLVERSDVLWAFRAWVRRWLQRLAELTAQGPFFRLLALCLRRCSRGHLSSHCRPPHSLRAQAAAGGELALCWTARRPERNPFHEESYACAWRRADAKPEDEAAWHETLVTENDYANGEGDRWGAVLRGLPAGVCLRLRVCAQGRHGRSDWSKEEIEIDMPTAAEAVARSRIVAGGSRLCLQCRTPQPARCPLAYASVECRPLFARGCPHGPFCARCRRAVSAQALPACVCRALVAAWREAA